MRASLITVEYALEKTRDSLPSAGDNSVEVLKRWIEADEGEFPVYAEAYAIVLRELMGEEAYVTWAAARRLGI